MSDKPVIHASFSIERLYDESPEQVFKAFADPKTKRRWFAEGEHWTLEKFETDFRIGGHERSEFRFKDGPLITNDTSYQDIVPNRRIVIVYTMTIGGAPLSSSLATIEFEPHGKGTKLTYTEQIACLDGNDQVAGRKDGCIGLFERLAGELGRKAAA